MGNQPQDLPLDHLHPGRIALFGSGETSPSGRRVFDRLLSKLPKRPRLVLLETPAGFELNSAQVIGRVGEFLEHRLQNYQPQVDIIRARRRGTPLSPDDPQIVAGLLEADLIFMGPGSPTYAVRQLRDSLAWHYLQARHQLGATLAAASAAVVAISAFTLPVYEIYKVGEDLHWKEGLNFFGTYGLPLVFVPHWNNNDGGEELDTSRCFMGQERFAVMAEMLPHGLTIVGIDEGTALIIDLQKGMCEVIGLGGVTLIHTGHDHNLPGPDLTGTGLAVVANERDSHIHVHPDGETFPLSECCPIDLRNTVQNLPPAAWKEALQAQTRLDMQREAADQPASPAAPPEVLALVDERQAARMRRDWAQADSLRVKIEVLGWNVKDTPDGPLLELGKNP